jgi:hypothetical protein
MMSAEVDMGDDYWAIRRLRNELEEERAATASAMRAQQQSTDRRMAAATGEINARVGAIAARLDALIELSDLREEMRPYSAHAQLRQIAMGAALEGLRPTQPIPDVPGYWLAPATRALCSFLSGEPAADDQAFAIGLDSLRASTFLAASLVLVELTEPAAELFARIVNTIGPHVTGAQRILWLAAAQGRFSERGADLLMTRLQELTVVEEASIRLCQAASSPDPLRKDNSRTIPTDVEKLVADTEESARLLVRLGELWSNSTLPIARVDASATDQQIEVLVAKLIGEGAAEEAPMLQRAAELQRATGGPVGVRRRVLDTPLPESRSHLDVLFSDLLQTNDPACQRLAATVLTPAMHLAHQNRSAPPTDTVPASIDVISHGVAVVIDGAPVPDASLAKVDAAIDAKRPLDTQRRTIGLGVAAVGLVSALVALAVGPALIVVGVLASIAGAVLAIRAHQALVDQRAARMSAKSSARRELNTATDDLASIRQRHAVAVESLSRSRDAYAVVHPSA